jgi:hypothetical protein
MDDLDGGLDLGFHFTASQIIASLVFSVVGIYLFRLGKKTLNYPVIFVSLALMIYPAFTHNPLQDWGIGVVLCGLAYYLHKNNNLTG